MATTTVLASAWFKRREHYWYQVFPTAGKGEGAVFFVDNVTIGAAFEGAELLLFEDEENSNWPMWDDQVSKDISSVVPVVVDDDQNMVKLLNSILMATQ